jgi:glutaredoxin
MEVTPIVFSMEGCPHCDNLKNQLKEANINFIEKDVDENERLYESFSRKVDSEYLPAVIVDKKVFLPERSFKTIDDGVELIKRYLQELSDRENRLD